MQDRALYSIQEARNLLGGISRNTIYHLLRTGQLASVPIGSRRFISAEAIADLIARSTTTVSPSRAQSIGSCPTRRPSLFPCLRQFEPESTEWRARTMRLRQCLKRPNRQSGVKGKPRTLQRVAKRFTVRRTCNARLCVHSRDAPIVRPLSM
jgi:excisionase family DNA binding protein